MRFHLTGTWYSITAKKYEARLRQLAEEKADLIAEVERLRKDGSARSSTCCGTTDHIHSATCPTSHPLQYYRCSQCEVPSLPSDMWSGVCFECRPRPEWLTLDVRRA